MEFLTWEMVVGVIGGLGTITATVWKIISLIKSARSDTAKKIASVCEETAVQKAQIIDLRNDVERLRDNNIKIREAHDKLSDLIIKLLTEK